MPANASERFRPIMATTGVDARRSSGRGSWARRSGCETRASRRVKVRAAGKIADEPAVPRTRRSEDSSVPANVHHSCEEKTGHRPRNGEGYDRVFFIFSEVSAGCRAAGGIEIPDLTARDTASRSTSRIITSAAAGARRHSSGTLRNGEYPLSFLDGITTPAGFVKTFSVPAIEPNASEKSTERSTKP